MLTIYKNKADIPPDMEYVELNDLFFNKNTAAKLDSKAAKIIEQIDGAKLIGKFRMKSKFQGDVLDIDCLSTGCKTILNVIYFPDKVFCLKECGENALEILYRQKTGSVYSDYAMIPFDMGFVEVVSADGKTVIDDYETLKEWWGDEE